MIWVFIIKFLQIRILVLDPVFPLLDLLTFIHQSATGYWEKTNSQMKMQETIAGEINFDDHSAKKVIMAAVKYAKTYPRCEENQKFFVHELTILIKYY
ncbi:hypothetical protein JHK82_048644 [Glycine max]|uniref:Uncharacterized protein n=1 Tax=Glycine max TaxID=3847 RepID=K7K0S9_SOYBN|nr:hypothetical protein GLYMA_17G232265v4 [Glycine max]KAG4379362.1 hypothetical protein GLYMA_17G232265v4 [Glycine max]KAG4944494.1 hypothetical protein JHK85_049140 [Glycine max]KAG5098790.1 hypothetical protein JHK82_048644 [Glycine max]